MGHMSAHFTLQEMTQSQTALRQGIDNTPSEAHIASLKALCDNVLEPVRDHYKRAVIVSSGYRSKALCKAIGSKPTSQHAKGEAADFEVPGVSTLELAQYIRDHLDFDQLILEYYDAQDPASGWVHCSYRADGKNRKQCLTYDGERYATGLVEA